MDALNSVVNKEPVIVNRQHGWRRAATKATNQRSLLVTPMTTGAKPPTGKL